MRTIRTKLGDETFRDQEPDSPGQQSEYQASPPITECRANHRSFFTWKAVRLSRGRLRLPAFTNATLKNECEWNRGVRDSGGVGGEAAAVGSFHCYSRDSGRGAP